MQFDEYELEAMGYAIYKHPLYPVVGLAAEAGEFASKLSKVMRKTFDPDGWASLLPEQMDELCDELGDVLWMITACAKELDYSLQAIAVQNLNKLEDRANRGVIDGTGDKR
jgi:NTP pyrophosphatase (non-canonical NTP hydrolase)